MPKLPFLRLEGVANVQDIGSLSVKRLERKLGVLPAEVMERIKMALRFVLDLGWSLSCALKAKWTEGQRPGSIPALGNAQGRMRKRTEG
jgi:hypothetical protein